MDDITSFAEKGSYLFAGSAKYGVFRSSDNGSTWKLSNHRLSYPFVRALAVKDPYIFAATERGVYRSSDDGDEWMSVSTGLPSLDIRSVAVRDTFLFASLYGMGLFRTSVNCTDWVAVNAGLETSTVVCLVFLDNYAYAATAAGQVFRSGDNGKSWNLLVWNLTGLRSMTFYKGVFFAATALGMYCSMDKGANWTQIYSPMAALMAGSAFASDQDFLYLGTYDWGIVRTADSGATWTPITTGFLRVGSNFLIQAMLATDKGIFAGCWSHGIYRSTDQGARWQSMTIGALYFDAHSILALDSTLFFSGEYGVYRSSDGGQTWSDVSIASIASGVYAIVAMDSTLFAGTRGRGVFRSEDKGLNWTSTNEGLQDSLIETLFALDNCLFAGTNRGGAFRSSDRGNTWVQTNTGLPTGYEIKVLSFAARHDSVGGPVLYAGTYSWGIYCSTDLGSHWRSITGDIPHPGVVNFTTICPVDTLLVVGTALHGMFRSTDHGLTWIRPETDFKANQGISAIVPVPTISGGHLLVAGFGESPWVYTSTDNGRTWTSADSGSLTTIASSFYEHNGFLYQGSLNGVWRRPVSQLVTSVSEDQRRGLPESVELKQNYPNPFNPTTTIEYSLPHRANVILTVYNTLGQRVATLVNGDIDAGYHSVHFNGSNLASGVYLYRLQAGDFVQTKKLCLIR